MNFLLLIALYITDVLNKSPKYMAGEPKNVFDVIYVIYVDPSKKRVEHYLSLSMDDGDAESKPLRIRSCSAGRQRVLGHDHGVTIIGNLGKIKMI